MHIFMGVLAPMTVAPAPPPVPPNATTSPRDGLRAPVQAAHRPPPRGRRRRDNDRPTPPGPACRGGFLAVATHNSARGDLHKSPPGETRNGDCSPLHSLKRCVSPRRQRLAVVKWYESTLKQNPTEQPKEELRGFAGTDGNKLRPLESRSSHFQYNC